MKRIEAIVRPHRVERLLESLPAAGATGLSVLETSGFGEQMGHSDVFKASERVAGLVPKRMLVIYVEDDKCDAVVQCVAEEARTGNIGDGIIVVSEVGNMIRIRDAEPAVK